MDSIKVKLYIDNVYIDTVYLDELDIIKKKLTENAHLRLMKYELEGDCGVELYTKENENLCYQALKDNVKVVIISWHK